MVRSMASRITAAVLVTALLASPLAATPHGGCGGDCGSSGGPATGHAKCCATHLSGSTACCEKPTQRSHACCSSSAKRSSPARATEQPAKTLTCCHRTRAAHCVPGENHPAQAMQPAEGLAVACERCCGSFFDAPATLLPGHDSRLALSASQSQARSTYLPAILPVDARAAFFVKATDTRLWFASDGPSRQAFLCRFTI